GRYTPNGGTVGYGQHECLAKNHVLILDGIGIIVQLCHYGQSHGQDHNGGRRIGDPHGQKGRGDHKSKDDVHHIGPHYLYYGQGNPFMEVPFFDGNGQNEPTYIEKDVFMPIGRRGLSQGKASGKGKQNDRQKGRNGNGNGLRYPPYRHPCNSGQNGIGGSAQTLWMEEKDDIDESEWP